MAKRAKERCRERKPPPHTHTKEPRESGRASERGGGSTLEQSRFLEIQLDYCCTALAQAQTKECAKKTPAVLCGSHWKQKQKQQQKKRKHNCWPHKLFAAFSFPTRHSSQNAQRESHAAIRRRPRRTERKKEREGESGE